MINNNKTNWEGEGVEPDIQAKPDNALEVAYEMALNQLKEKSTPHKNQNN